MSQIVLFPVSRVTRCDHGRPIVKDCPNCLWEYRHFEDRQTLWEARHAAGRLATERIAGLVLSFILSALFVYWLVSR
jgi:hypothetical protein